MQTLFGNAPDQLRQYLLEVLQAMPEDERYEFDAEMRSSLSEFVGRGKLIRGSVVIAFAKLLGFEHTASLLPIASGLELMGSGILIQDDIMDQDELRRGKKSMHVTWSERLQAIAPKRHEHLGSSLAICMSDYLFFLATTLLAEAEIPEALKQKLLLEHSYQMRLLSLAQVEDLRLSETDSVPDTQTILSMYEGKTGQYTGVWPLVTAGLVAGVDEATIRQLREIGLAIGVLYQLTDDRLDMFGSSAVIGKTAGSDIRQGKKTLYYSYLMQLVNDTDRATVQSIFGNQSATETECQQVIALLQQYQVDNKVDGEIEDMVKKVIAQIESTTMCEEAQDFLKKLVNKVANRTK